MFLCECDIKSEYVISFVIDNIEKILFFIYNYYIYHHIKKRAFN